jgi:threonine/homoserine/homoserine lactone efflux protein
MAQNPDAPAPTRAQVISKAASRHAEAITFAAGMILGCIITILGVLVGR